MIIDLRDRYGSIVNHDVDVGCIRSISIKELDDKLEIRVIINRSKSNSIVHRMHKMDGNIITFFDAIGFDDEFKWLFNGLYDISTFSKKEISNIIRTELVYDYTNHKKAVFPFYISLDDLQI